MENKNRINYRLLRKQLKDKIQINNETDFSTNKVHLMFVRFYAELYKAWNYQREIIMDWIKKEEKEQLNELNGIKDNKDDNDENHNNQNEQLKKQSKEKINGQDKNKEIISQKNEKNQKKRRLDFDHIQIKINEFVDQFKQMKMIKIIERQNTDDLMKRKKLQCKKQFQYDDEQEELEKQKYLQQEQMITQQQQQQFVGQKKKKEKILNKSQNLQQSQQSSSSSNKKDEEQQQQQKILIIKTKEQLQQKLFSFIQYPRIDIQLEQCNITQKETNEIKDQMRFQYRIKEISMALNNNHINDEGLKDISKILSEEYLYRLELKLHQNDYTESSIMYLLQGISYSKKLQYLYLNIDPKALGHQSIIQISYAIKNLKELNKLMLYMNNITNLSINIFEYLMNSIQQLEKLNYLSLELCNNNLGCNIQYFKYLSNLIKKLQSINLIELNLSYNNINYEQIKVFIDGIKFKDQFIKKISLDISGNNLSDNSIHYILNYLSQKQNLIAIQLFMNNNNLSQNIINDIKSYYNSILKQESILKKYIIY